MAVQVKKTHQFIKTTYLGNYQVKINNSYFFRNIDHTQLNWEVIENGKIIAKGTVADLAVGPRAEITVALPVKIKQQAGKEYFLNVHYVLKEAEPFLEKGYEVAYEQFALNKVEPATQLATAKGTLQINKTENIYTVSGKDFKVEFDVKEGILKSYFQHNEQLLEKGPVPAYWRAPADNDIGAGFNKNLRKWRNAYQKSKLISSDLKQNADGSYTMNFKKELLDGEATQESLTTVFADGTLKVDNHLNAVKGKYPLLLRVGTDLELKKEYENIEFYGRGPWENYWDRKTASLVGLYKQKTKDQYFGYARPQESGNKTDVRWVNFTNQKGKGLQFVYENNLLSFSALPYSLDDLDPEQDKKQYHSGELTARNSIYVHMDAQQSGVQGIDSWGSSPLKEYRVPFADQNYSYWIKPIK